MRETMTATAVITRFVGNVGQKHSTRRNRVIGYASLVLLAGILVESRAQAAPGDLDPSFDLDGFTLTNVADHNVSGARDFAIQSDGKIVVVGDANNGGNYDFAVLRYNANGSLDSSFDDDGKVITAVGSRDDEATSVAIQGDGRILVAGWSDNDFAVVRYNTDGSLDPAFGVGGMVKTDFAGIEYATSLAIQIDGKFIVCGYSVTSTSRFALARYNIDGTLDTGFDGDGRVTTTVGASDDNASAVAIQNDGKIVVAGYSSNGANYDFALVRYNTDGSLDTGLDGDGKLTTAVGAGNDVATALVVQADGKLLVTGYSGGADSDFEVVRYNPNGSLDSTFDGDGKVTTNLGIQDFANSIAVQPDAKIIVAGAGIYNDFGLVRYNPNGSLDTSFDGDGKVTTGFGGEEVAFSLALQSDGKVLIAGYERDNNGYDLGLARYNSNGSLDTSFDGDGNVRTALGKSSDTAYGGAIQSDGKIVVVGGTYTANTGNFAVLRYDPDGTLDPGFDGDGIAVTDIAGHDTASSVAIQSDGKLVVVGSAVTGVYVFVAVRYNANGSLDTGFDGDGKVTTSIGSSSSLATSVAIQSDGKILVGGYFYNGSDYDFALVRYNPNGSLDASFDGDGKLTTAVGTGDDKVNAIALQADGKIVVGGSTRSVSRQFALARYNINGSLDTTFAGDGTVTTPVGLTDDEIHAIVVQDDGKIVAAGSSRRDYPGYNDFAVARYDTNGNLDTSFDDDGIVTTNFTGDGDIVYSVRLQPDGKIVAAGSSRNGNLNFSLARYNPNGSLDSQFGNAGATTTDFMSGEDYPGALMIQGDGKLVVVGHDYGVLQGDIIVARYLIGLCGNGILEDSEACDDGGLISGDGCNPTCQIDTGWNCAGAPSACSAIFGDGVIVGGEECDDGNANPGDGCSAGSVIEAGYLCTGMPSTCTTCGNGTVDAGEDCDPSIALTDCCSSTCQYETALGSCASDSDSCTDDICDGTGTCTHPNNASPCTDGVFCNGVDSCGGGSCSVHAGNPCTGGGECADICNESAGNCLVASGTVCADEGNPCTSDQCDGTGACVHLDSDADGTGDLCDNCATTANPDQQNSDCPDPAFFPAGCATTPPSTKTGCCDGGDVCDACPAQKDNTNCDQSASAGASVGSSGGTIETPDGSVTVQVPPGALAADTSITVTENGLATRFTLQSSNVFSISTRPENQRFDLPVTVTMRWKDRDDDGRIDRGQCVGGVDDTLSCDAAADCASGNCSLGSNLQESAMVLKRNSAKFSKDGFGGSAAPFDCDSHLSGACATAVADCSDATGTGQATVANCCDKTNNEWTFQTCSFSEYTLGDPVGGLIPGNGSAASDCVTEWVVDNPMNTPAADKRGFPNMAQSCTDGDASCDADGVANDQCAFEVAVCMNVNDPRLVDKNTGLAACTPTSIAVWAAAKPLPDSTKPAEAPNAIALRDSLGALGTNSVSGTHGEVVTFTPTVANGDACTDFVEVVVPLKNGSKTGKTTVKSRATTADGVKDSDGLKLTCVPAP